MAFIPTIEETQIHGNNLGLKKIFEDRYEEFLEVAKQGEQRCFDGKRWSGHAVLVVVDAALDSIGLNYFQIVVPRVRRFYDSYVKTGEIHSCEDMSKLSPEDSRLKKIINNKRVWEVAISISKELNRIKREKAMESDYAALRLWAKNSSYENWQHDPIGKIKGIGFITFQYLRMQAGVDTTMPDKVIKKAVREDFGIEAKDDIEFIKKVALLSSKVGYSQIVLCWAIWLRSANVATSDWESLH